MTNELIIALGWASAMLFGFLILIIFIGIMIEECNAKVKFWRLVWRRIRKKLEGK